MSSSATIPALRLRIDGTTFRDSKNREVTLHGINVAGDAKFPTIPDGRSHITDRFFDGDNVKFIGRPFTVDEAGKHFARLRRWGYNTIRYIFTWEAIEHEGPGKYDEQWIQHTIQVLRKARAYGFHVFMDPHQDVVCTFRGAALFGRKLTSNSGLDSPAAPERQCGPYTRAASIPRILPLPRLLSSKIRGRILRTSRR